MRFKTSSCWRWLTLALMTAPLIAHVMYAQPAGGRVALVPDSAQMLAVMSMGQRMQKPAQFVLDHRVDLALTPEQVPFLDALVKAQAESVSVRQDRLMASMRAAAAKRSSAAPRGITWSGPVDEQAMRDLACEQSALSAESMINMSRDRHAVGAALTSAQLAMLPQLETADMMKGMRPALPRPTKGGVYFEFQVEQQVRQVPGIGGTKYPETLRSAQVEGEVLAQFVVDATGSIEPGSFKVLKSSHDLFTQAVRDALPAMKFTPAEVGGEKVRQLVQQPFTFGLSRP